MEPSTIKDRTVQTWLRAIVVTAALTLLAGCEEGVWVESTATATFSKRYTVQMEPDANLVVAQRFNLDDLAGVIDDIPNDAEIISVEISYLSGSYEMFESTTADSLGFTYELIDHAGALSPMAGRKIIDGRDPVLGFLGLQAGIRTKFNIVPQIVIAKKLSELKDELNRFMSSRGSDDPNPRVGVGFTIETFGGPFHADVSAEVHVQVRYRECTDEDWNGVITSSLEACQFFERF